jgi:hypothetical protein
MGLLDFPFQVPTVLVPYAGALRKPLKKKGPLGADAMRLVAATLERSLPPAAG